MCRNAGDVEFRQSRKRAAFMELAREIAELNEALRRIAELEAESRRFGMRRLWLMMRRRLKLRKKIPIGGMAALFVWLATIVCLAATGRTQMALLWLSFTVMFWLALGIVCCL